jgi:hypothetical protein
MIIYKRPMSMFVRIRSRAKTAISSKQITVLRTRRMRARVTGCNGSLKRLESSSLIARGVPVPGQV